MEGPEELLVTKTSATHCSRPGEDGPEHICPIRATHSDIVKFGRYDAAYDPVRHRISSLCRRAVQAGEAKEDPSRKCAFLGHRGNGNLRNPLTFDSHRTLPA